MKKGSLLPPSDHVLRFIDKKYISGQIIQGAGFFRRPKETASSVDWLEFHGKSHGENVQTCINNFTLNTHVNDRFVELNIGKTLNLAKTMLGREGIAFTYDPSRANKAHSLIHGLPERNNENTSENELFDDILRIAITQTYMPKRA
jgi:hypothetical protein